MNLFCILKNKMVHIQVFPAVSSIKKDKIVEFADGQSGRFDVIIFATGYRSNVLKWLKVDI